MRGAAAAFYAVVALVVVLIGGSAFQLTREPPAPQATASFPASTRLSEATASMPLPVAGAAAVAVPGLGVIASTPPAAPAPIASMTKMMTAFVILRDHPLAPGQPGPTLEMTARDVQAYLRMISEDQSTLPVVAGLRFSEYEMLQGLLVPSANNFAEALALWDAGSVDAFVAKMNAAAAGLGMTSTRYADASGFAAGNVSTPNDQLMLAMTAMQNPVFATIVSQSEAQLPGIGRVTNVNVLLGTAGIVGIKTGFTEEAGGCLTFLSRRTVDGQPVEVYGVVMGQPTRPQAFALSERLIAAASAGLRRVNAVTEDRAVGLLDTAWGEEHEVVAAEGADFLYWPGMTLEADVSFEPVSPSLAAGAEIGVLTLRIGGQSKTVPLVSREAVDGPGLFWRLTRR